MAASSSDPLVPYHPFYDDLQSGEFSRREDDDYGDDKSSEDRLTYRPKSRPATPSHEVMMPAFGRGRSYTLTQERHSFIKTDKILRLTARFAYGLLPCWPERHNRCLYTVSALIALLQILAFGEYIYCVKNFWLPGNSTGPGHSNSSTSTSPTASPHIPTVTLIMEIGLIISGIISFVLACRYFHGENQNFEISHCELIPHVEFPLTEDEGYVGPSPKDWLITNACLSVAFLDIFFVILVDFRWDAYFDFIGIHNFLHSANLLEKVFYYAYIVVFTWGLASAVVSCCVFHILTRDIIQHINVTENHIISARTDSYLQARGLHEELLKYREKLIEKFQFWFTTHNILFFFILLCMIFDWFEATKDVKGNITDHKVLWASQLLASLLIAFKFSFPFLSASRVTARFQRMYYLINRQKMFPDIRDLPKFLDYAERCNYGFVVFGFRITTNIALITILTTFIGIVKFLAD